MNMPMHFLALGFAVTMSLGNTVCGQTPVQESSQATSNRLALSSTPTNAPSTVNAAAPLTVNVISSSAPPKITLESITGPLKAQDEIFSKLNITPSAVTTNPEVAPEQRFDFLSDGSSAAWQDDVYCWTAPAFFHHPLYFEQVNLERYGQGTYRCLQPAASAAHFFGTLPILPYKIGGQAWDERLYTLGHGRPGNFNRYQLHYHPFSWRGVTYQAAATTGIIFLVP